MRNIKIKKYSFNFLREPLIKPFCIKGSSFSEKWTLITLLESYNGIRAVGIGGTAVLWSDPHVFSRLSEAGSNALMALIAEKGAQLVLGRGFYNPIDLLESIIPELHQYGIKILENMGLTRTFILNSLVSLDLALWIIYGLEKGLKNFDSLIPEEFQPLLSTRQKFLIHVPTISYDYSLKNTIDLVNNGYFFLKVKLGQAGDVEEMLQKDCQRLDELFHIFKKNKELRFYLDLNGRYPNKDALMRLLYYIEEKGALRQVLLLEEPFPENNKEDVSDLPIRIVADESVSTMEGVEERISLGYSVIAIKPAGKTLSISLKMASVAHKMGVPLFVADNACVPWLVEWNKNFAARLKPLPGFSFGILESNGAQNYKFWKNMLEDHPFKGATWIEPKKGLYCLDEKFYDCSGGIFLTPKNYSRLVE